MHCEMARIRKENLSEDSYLKQAPSVSVLPRVNTVTVLNSFVLGKLLKIYFYVKILYIEDCKYKCRRSLDQMTGRPVTLITQEFYVKSLTVTT